MQVDFQNIKSYILGFPISITIYKYIHSLKSKIEKKNSLHKSFQRLTKVTLPTHESPITEGLNHCVLSKLNNIKHIHNVLNS